jgi:hypothetical protein
MERRTSGAEAHDDFMTFLPGINPRPTLKQSFSAAYEAVPFVHQHNSKPCCHSDSERSHNRCTVVFADLSAFPSSFRFME